MTLKNLVKGLKAKKTIKNREVVKVFQPMEEVKVRLTPGVRGLLAQHRRKLGDHEEIYKSIVKKAAGSATIALSLPEWQEVVSLATDEESHLAPIYQWLIALKVNQEMSNPGGAMGRGQGAF